MMARVWVVALAAAAMTATDLTAQAVPEGSQATKVGIGYRRFSQFRVDPFRNVMIPHWGFVFSAGATAENNVLSMADFGALDYLDSNDEILIADWFDLVGRVPQGQGVRVVGQAEGGFHLGGPIGQHFHIGLSAQARSYGSGLVEDDLVTLIRDGNAGQQSFDVGSTGGSGLVTGEFGAHVVLRFGPLGGTDDGVHLAIGGGARWVRPAAYGRGRLQDGSSSILRITSDSVRANLAFEVLQTPLDDVAAATDRIRAGDGAGLVGDFLVRLEWPTQGVAFEAMIANLGSVTITGAERDTASFVVSTDDPFNDLQTAFDGTNLETADTVDVDVTLPRIVRFSAGAWANRFLQIDLAATLPVSGEFDQPLTVDVGTTWRFIRHLPLRAGLIMGGHQGLGYSGGFAIESRNILFQVAGQSLGGFFRQARGVGLRMDFGIFF